MKAGTITAARRKARQRGFTLLELLIVLAIIALGTSLIIPAIGSAENKAFNADVRQAVAALNYARRIAIARSTTTTATFRSEQLESEAVNPREFRTQMNGDNHLPAWQSGRIALAFRTTPDEQPESVEEVEIQFFPQGGSTGGVLEFRQEERFAVVRVDPLTGRIDARQGEDFE